MEIVVTYKLDADQIKEAIAEYVAKRANVVIGVEKVSLKVEPIYAYGDRIEGHSVRAEAVKD